MKTGYGARHDIGEAPIKSKYVIPALRQAQDRLTFGQAGIQYF